MNRIFDKIYIVPKLGSENLHDVVSATKWIESAGISSEPTIRRIEFDDIDNRTLVIAVGGDGTMLEAMRIAALKGAIATGVNLGHVGFLTDFTSNASNVKPPIKLFDDMLVMFHKSAEYPVEQRMSLQIVNGAQHDCNPKPVFNEFVLSNLYSDGLIRYHLKINDVDAGYHRANGIIVGTPTGSTAYTLSNGGGLLYPSMNVMQIVPIAPLSMSSRPIIVPGDAFVRITVETEGTWTVKGDGNRLCSFDKSESIEITQYHKCTRILHTKEWNFFDMLTNKLHWKHI